MIRPGGLAMLVVMALLIIALAAAIYLAVRRGRQSRARFLAEYRLPEAIVTRFRAKHPQLTDGDAALVQEGLRQYFQVCQRARGKLAAMPSQVVDDLWHEFILFTRNYRHFCNKAYWRYLHHTPVEAMSGPTQATDSIRRTWLHACRLEGMNPKAPVRLPLLFALDAQLGVANGFFYSLNCSDAATSSSNLFCASDIGCAGGASCGGGTSWGGSGCGGHSGGHGDGGSGCGGGSGCSGGGCGGGGGD